MFDLKAIQSALDEFGLDAWLFYDFHGSNPLARRILDFEESSLTTRRWFYLVPAMGEPRKLVHRIEQDKLDHLPGSKHTYLPWRGLEAALGELVSGCARVAMEYSPRNAIPYVSKVDAGTVELLRETGVEVVSSGDLVQRFEATLDDEQYQSHLDSERHVLAAHRLAADLIRERVREGKRLTETEVQSAMMGYFEKAQMITDHAPIVAVGPHAGDPHYAPSPGSDAEIKPGDLVLVDAWGRLPAPRAVYSDYTRMFFVGDNVPGPFADVFAIVARARDAAVHAVRDAFAEGRAIHGCDVDDAARRVIEESGYGDDFIHRTGHNIAQDLHGNGTHMDNLETRDERRILPRTLFSVEPGIYLSEFGVRSEVNVFVDGNGHVHVTGEPQAAIEPIS